MKGIAMGTVEIKNGDCLDLMKDLPEQSIDMVMTSPPYDNLRDYGGIIEQWSFNKFKKIANEFFRIIKNGGVVVWVVADATINGSETGTSFKQALYFKECGFNIHDTMIWDKQISSAIGSLNRYENVFEYMFILSKGKPKKTNIIMDKPNKNVGCIHHGSIRLPDGKIKKTSSYGKRKVNNFGRRHNIWEITSCRGNERNLHPAMYPVKLAKDHIITWSDENDLVLDPFMGSGTTGLACIDTNRNFIGFELNKDYFEISKKRISDYQSQIKLEGI